MLLHNNPQKRHIFHSVENSGQNLFRGKRDIVIGTIDESGVVPAAPTITGYVPLTGTILTPLSMGATGVTGTPPLTFSKTAGTYPTGGLTLNTSTGVITGTPTNSGTFTFEITVSNDEGSASTSVVLVIADNTPPDPGYTIRWGNFMYADYPTAGPTFVAGDFTGSNADYVDTQTSSALTRNGSYIFSAREGARQVIWLADTLLSGSPTFTVNGFPWSIDPSVNTPYQALTILGVAGHVYFTDSQNAGGYTLVIA